MSNTRREFLKATGGLVGAAGLLALTGCDAKDVYGLEKPAVPGGDSWRRGEEKWVTSICGQCYAGCGIRVRVVEGRVIKNEGNYACPLNKGGIGPKGQSGVQMLYHPDRVTGPMRQEPRGSGNWVAVKWEDAIKDIAAKLGAKREISQSHGLVVIDGEPRGPMRDLFQRFMTAYGSPNLLDHRSVTDGGKMLAMQYMQGVSDLPAYDWENTRYAIGFGSSLFESWCQSIYFTRAAAYLKQGVPGRRVKFVQVSPRFSVTSAKSDEWVPIHPATYGALALGLGHVLVRDNLYDKTFVAEHTFGFDTWKDEQGQEHRGFKQLLLADYTPDKVAKITGVPEDTIVRIAHEMSAHQPAVAFADGQAAAATNGLGTAMAIHALNALLGNCERPGGVWVQRKAPLTPWKELPAADEVAEIGLAMPRVDGAGAAPAVLANSFVQNLPEAILTDKPYPVHALMLYQSNPVFSKPLGKKWKEVLQKVPLVVSFSPIKDESTFWADYLLPEGSYLERWELVEPVPNVRFPVIGLRQPAVDSLYDTQAAGDTLIQLAKEIGGAVGAAFPWKTYKLAMIERLKGVFAAKSGSIVESSFGKFGALLHDNGGWWDTEVAPEQWAVGFQTPSGKFEFYSQAIARRLGALKEGELATQLAAGKVTSNGDDLCLPHWEPPRFDGDPQTHPFLLMPYRGVNYAEGGARHLPWLAELPMGEKYSWRERVELNPEDAAKLGLKDGEEADVETSAGKARLLVRVLPTVGPGLAGMPLGQGPWPPKPEDAETGGGYGLLANRSDPLGGILSMQEMRAKISKVTV